MFLTLLLWKSGGVGGGGWRHHVWTWMTYNGACMCVSQHFPLFSVLHKKWFKIIHLQFQNVCNFTILAPGWKAQFSIFHRFQLCLFKYPLYRFIVFLIIYFCCLSLKIAQTLGPSCLINSTVIALWQGHAIGCANNLCLLK